MPKTVQTRDVPDDVHRRLTARAADERRSLSELLRAEVVELALVRHRHDGLRRRAWELRHRCSAYDAFYVALAEVLDAELLTTDDRLDNAARGLVVTVR